MNVIHLNLFHFVAGALLILCSSSIFSTIWGSVATHSLLDSLFLKGFRVKGGDELVAARPKSLFSP
jgi:hypothetical protein